MTDRTMSTIFDGTSRQARQWARTREKQAIKTGDWGPWDRIDLPDGIPGGGWCRDIRFAASNRLYAVLCRPLATKWGTVIHCAIRTASNLEPPWRDKQRIKDELFGPEFTAVEVMPPRDEIIDEADMYHIWVMLSGARLPFTLYSRTAND